jgi:hypothetical protein
VQVCSASGRRQYHHHPIGGVLKKDNLVGDRLTGNLMVLLAMERNVFGWIFLNCTSQVIPKGERSALGQT